MQFFITLVRISADTYMYIYTYIERERTRERR